MGVGTGRPGDHCLHRGSRFQPGFEFCQLPWKIGRARNPPARMAYPKAMRCLRCFLPPSRMEQPKGRRKARLALGLIGVSGLLLGASPGHALGGSDPAVAPMQAGGVSIASGSVASGLVGPGPDQLGETVKQAPIPEPQASKANVLSSYSFGPHASDRGPQNPGGQGALGRGTKQPLSGVPKGAFVHGSVAGHPGWGPAGSSRASRAGRQRSEFGEFDLSERRYPRRSPRWEDLEKAWQKKLERWDGEVAEPEAKVQEAAMRQALEGLLQVEARYARMDPQSQRQREREQQARETAHALDWTWRQWLGRETHAGTWLTHLALTPTANIKQRARALELLVAARHGDAETLLIHQANQAGNALRPYALAAMARWPRQALDRHLARLYSEHSSDAQVVRLLLHRVQNHGPLHSEAERELTPTLVQQLIQDDWQTAGQALLLLKRFEPEARFEALMAAMPTVAQGVREGKSRWRILADIAEQLREITGRSMGNDPRPWLTFYERYHAGQLPLQVDQDAAPGGISRTQFFGIGQVSDHVTFVIDVSGSMETAFATTGHSAYEEAVNQLVGYLQDLGDQAWFRVVIFSDNASVLVSLRRADASTMKGLKKTLLRKKPGGGTALGSGIQKALRVNRSKKGPKGAHASDTIIVLCDGATMEGRRWAEDLLASPDFPSGLRFHCVQIGSSPAAAMKALAKRTGGRFVRR